MLCIGSFTSIISVLLLKQMPEYLTTDSNGFILICRDCLHNNVYSCDLRLGKRLKRGMRLIPESQNGSTAGI